MRWLIFGLAVVLFGAGTGRADIIVDDQFTDGGRSDGSDPLDISWFKSRADMELTIADDPVIGGGNALHVNTVSRANSPPTNFIVGTFAPAVLGNNVGDRVQARFDFRFNGTVPVDTGANFRLGILSSAGTAIESDVFTSWEDDVGYGASFEASASVFAGNLKRHLGAGIGGPGDPWLPTVTSGSLDNLGDTSVKHTATWTIERVATSSVQVTFQLDGLEAVTVDSAGNRIETFDELVVRGHHNTLLDFTIDNVRVETIQAVPEPSTLVMSSIFAFLGIAYGRRRRKAA